MMASDMCACGKNSLMDGCACERNTWLVCAFKYYDICDENVVCVGMWFLPYDFSHEVFFYEILYGMISFFHISCNMTHRLPIMKMCRW
jgi:hypothetical protein